MNSGCIGLSRENADFARIWQDLMYGLEAENIDMSVIKFEGDLVEFAKMDQDVLNVTVMATQTPLALLGREAMGVYPRNGAILPHAMFDKTRGSDPIYSMPCAAFPLDARILPSGIL